MSNLDANPSDESWQALVISRNLRQIREMRGITSVQLSREAKVARGTLHQLEAGKGNPRMDTLYSLARILNVTLSDLVTEPALEQTVIRAGEGPTVGTAGMTARLLRGFELARGTLELSEISVVEKFDHVTDAHQPGVFEHVLIAQGIIRVGPLGEEVVLQPGDYMKFRADRQHHYQVLDGPALGTLLMEYPLAVGRRNAPFAPVVTRSDSVVSDPEEPYEA